MYLLFGKDTFFVFLNSIDNSIIDFSAKIQFLGMFNSIAFFSLQLAIALAIFLVILSRLLIDLILFHEFSI